MFFGVVSASDAVMTKRYRIKEFPHIILVKATEKRPYNFKGEMKYQDIFEFLNVHSEAFVAGGGSSGDTAATKVWLTELVPELNILSADDICLRVEKTLCVILIQKGDVPDQEMTFVM